jgi:hypothetical protein
VVEEAPLPTPTQQGQQQQQLDTRQDHARPHNAQHLQSQQPELAPQPHHYLDQRVSDMQQPGHLASVPRLAARRRWELIRHSISRKQRHLFHSSFQQQPQPPVSLLHAAKALSDARSRFRSNLEKFTSVDAPDDKAEGAPARRPSVKNYIS